MYTHFMKILSRIFFAILFFQAAVSRPALAEPASCGFTQACDKALVCVGATDTKNNGQCILSPIVLSVCTIFNKIQDATVYFMIFSVVALGFAFFLGKISWGMIISVILGIVMIKGAILITQKTTGIGSNYCDIELVEYSRSCSNATWELIPTQSRINANKILNTEATDLCAAMQCIKKTCSAYNRWGIKSNGTPSNIPTLAAVNTVRSSSGLPSVASLSGKYKLVANSRQISVTGITTYTGFLPDGDEAYFIMDELSNISISQVPIAHKLFLSCTDTSASSGTNYLACKNLCTDVVRNIETTKDNCKDALV